MLKVLNGDGRSCVCQTEASIYLLIAKLIAKTLLTTIAQEFAPRTACSEPRPDFLKNRFQINGIDSSSTYFFYFTTRLDSMYIDWALPVFPTKNQSEV